MTVLNENGPSALLIKEGLGRLLAHDTLWAGRQVRGPSSRERAQRFDDLRRPRREGTGFARRVLTRTGAGASGVGPAGEGMHPLGPRRRRERDAGAEGRAQGGRAAAQGRGRTRTRVARGLPWLRGRAGPLYPAGQGRSRCRAGGRFRAGPRGRGSRDGAQRPPASSSSSSSRPSGSQAVGARAAPRYRRRGVLWRPEGPARDGSGPPPPLATRPWTAGRSA